MRRALLCLVVCGCGRVGFGAYGGSGGGGGGGDASGGDGVGTVGDGGPDARANDAGCVTAGAGGWTVIAMTGGGANQSCAVLDDHSLWCWGFNSYGEVGNGTTANVAAPIKIALGGAVAQLASKGGQGAVTPGHTCALRGDGVAWCWGDNGSGELGDGTVTG